MQRVPVRFLVFWLATVVALPAAQAQLRAPGVPGVPTLPQASPHMLGPTLGRLQQAADAQASAEQHKLALRQLLRQYSDRLEADPQGQPILRRQILGIVSSPSALVAIRAAGFQVLSERDLQGLGLNVVVFAGPEALPTAQARDRLRELDPQGTYDFNHLYLPSGDGAASGPSQPAVETAKASAPGVDTGSVRVGLIDGGVDVHHPALRKPAFHPWGCEGRPVPSAHGTAVASLLVGESEDFRGAAPGAELFAADVYCGEAAGGAADTLLGALAWLAQEGIAVINISLVGPANRILETALHSLTQRGCLIVAAVGNDGPAAPLLYPAAYDGVIGVTAVDARRRALPEAARGPQVAYAAPGANMAAAANGSDDYIEVRGTSFAAPIVAGLLAGYLREASPAAATQALAKLTATAIDLGAHGRDTTYGNGLVGADIRVDPDGVPLTRGGVR